MKSFIKLVTANLVAFSILFGLLAVFSFLGIAAFSVAFEQKQVAVKDGSVLVINLNMNISDAPPEKELADYVNEAIDGKTQQNRYLYEFMSALDQAAHDNRISALFLHGSLFSQNYGSGYATLTEMKKSLDTFKASGKPIYAYAVAPSIRDYYLLSSATTLYMNPYGLLRFNGMASEMIYFGNAFEKYGIGIQTTRVGKYKSAVEMFTSDHMSDNDRQQTSELLNGIWNELVTDIAVSREMAVGELKQLANDEAFFEGEKAKQRGFVDEVAYFDEVLATLGETYPTSNEKKSFEQIMLSSYISDMEGAILGRFGSSNKIAVVYAEGDIVDGEGQRDQVGGSRLSRSIRKLRKDDEVKAIVLRVNSPGGSAVASEFIQREIRETRKTKPVVVSMGTLAASGGYWISAYSDKIFAEPSTITGSIGVFGILFNVEDIAKNFGLAFDGVKTSQFSDIYSIARPKSEEELALIQKFTDIIYDEFIRKVAEGRELPIEQVKEIAQGRVWTGLAAKEIGLVDELGGLQDAINYAVKLAGVASDWELIHVPEKEDFAKQLEAIMEEGQGSPVGQVSSDPFQQALTFFEREFSFLKSFNDPRGVYARLPFKLNLN